MENTKFILVNHTNLHEHVRLEFFTVDTERMEAANITPLIAAVPQYVKTFSNGTLWVRGGCVYGSQQLAWRGSVCRLFDNDVEAIQPLFKKAMKKTPEYEAIIAELAGLDVIIVD